MGSRSKSGKGRPRKGPADPRADIMADASGNVTVAITDTSARFVEMSLNPEAALTLAQHLLNNALAAIAIRNANAAKPEAKP